MKILHELVADKLERDPALLRIARENIDRWLANGHTAPGREHYAPLGLDSPSQRAVATSTSSLRD